MRKSKRQYGFTLVETAVVLVIAGTILGAGLKLAAVQAERSAIKTTQTNQEIVKQALATYLAKMGRLPCPDTNAIPDGRDAEDRGGAAPAACLSYFGRIPYIDLGIDQDNVVDGWDNYMTYVLSPGYRLTFNSNAVPDLYFTNLPAVGFAAGVTQGAINVSDRFPANAAAPTLIADRTTFTGVAVAIISHGINGFGALNQANSFNEAPAAGTDEARNVNPAITATTLDIFKRDYIDDADLPPFDDVVLTIRPDEFVTDLVARGAVTIASPAAILNKANEYVIAQILSTRATCLVPICLIGSYYSVPNIANNSFPDYIQQWNIAYTPTALTRVHQLTNTNTLAYTLSVTAQGVTETKQVTIQPLKATLAVTSGFI